MQQTTDPHTQEFETEAASLKKGDAVLMEIPRGEAVPSVYGPTADENPFE